MLGQVLGDGSRAERGPGMSARTAPDSRGAARLTWTESGTGWGRRAFLHGAAGQARRVCVARYTTGTGVPV